MKIYLLVLFHLLCSEYLAQDLAHRRLGQSGAELDGSGCFVGGQMLAAVGDDLLRIQMRAGIGDQERAGHLAQAFVGRVIDVDQNQSLPSGYEVYVDGGRTATGADAVEWAKKVDSFGVPVIGSNVPITSGSMP